MITEAFLTRSIIQTLGWTLLHFIWQGLLVALIMAGINAVLNRHSASHRYVVACCAMLSMIALPILTFLFLQSSLSQAVVSPAIAQATPASSNSLAVTANLTDQSLEGAYLISKQVPLFFPWLTGLWLAGVLALSLRLLGEWRGVQKLKKPGIRPVNEECREYLVEVIQKLQISRPVSTFESPVLQVPTMIGWMRPVILLPTSVLTGLTPEQFRAIISHELAHIRRYDYPVNLLQTVIETLLFYHPAVWWMSRQVRIERENCCDDIAAAVCGDVMTYARALTGLEHLGHSAEAGLALAATGGSLAARIRRLVRKPAHRSNRIRLWMAGGIILVMLPVAGLGVRSAFLNSLPYEPVRYPQGTPEAEAAEALKVLLTTLKGRNFEMQGDVVSALSRIKSSGTITPLVEALSNGDESTREKAAWALGNLGDHRAVDPLVEAMKRGDGRGQHTVAWALGMIGDIRAVEPLIEALKAGNPDLRHGSAWALGKIGDKRAVEPLIPLLKDEAADVRHGAVWALGMIGDPRAVEPLREVLNDRDPDVRNVAQQVLSRLSRQ